MEWDCGSISVSRGRMRFGSVPSRSGFKVDVARKTLSFTCDRRRVHLRAEEVDFVESAGNYIVFQGRRSFVVRGTMKEVTDLLNRLGFVRCHRRFLVDPRKVVKRRTTEVV